MCLTHEWFEEREARKRRRDRHGVSFDEAKKTLFFIHSTIEPVAVEMAEWIEENWSPEEIARMDAAMRADYDEALAESRRVRAWLATRSDDHR